MPLIARSVTSALNGGESAEEMEQANQLSDFAFLYGTFPTAPTVYVIALRYNLCADVMASAMVACTFVSAPIMFMSGKTRPHSCLICTNYNLRNILYNI